MKLVRIIRDSVRKNPEAGDGELMVHGTKKIAFRVIGSLPPELLFDNRITITSTIPPFTEGLLLNEEAAELLKGYTYDLITEPTDALLEHVIEDEYLYEYENPPIECLNCHSYTLYDDIDYEFDDMLMPLLVCPHCKGEYTFEEFEEEKIEDVLKELGLE